MRHMILLIVALVAACAAASFGAGDSSSKPQTGRWAVIETNKGTIKIALYEKDAPNTTKNFIDLVAKKFYDGFKFHRVEDWVIQTGDPTGTGTGGSDTTIKLEVSPKLKHDAAGVVGMARSQNPDSARSQFYIITKATPFLDMNYAVFGKVVEGLDVVNKIQIGDIMTNVRIVSAPKPAPKKAPAKKKTDK